MISGAMGVMTRWGGLPWSMVHEKLGWDKDQEVSPKEGAGAWQKMWGCRGKVGVLSNRANNLPKPTMRKEELSVSGEHKEDPVASRTWGGSGVTWESLKSTPWSLNPKVSFPLGTILILPRGHLTFRNVKHLVWLPTASNWLPWDLNVFIPFAKLIPFSGVYTLRAAFRGTTVASGEVFFVPELGRNLMENFYVLFLVRFLFLFLSKVDLAGVDRSLPNSYALLLNGFSCPKSPSPWGVIRPCPSSHLHSPVSQPWLLEMHNITLLPNQN